jgi:hypothetical protein
MQVVLNIEVPFALCFVSFGLFLHTLLKISEILPLQEDTFPQLYAMGDQI